VTANYAGNRYSRHRTDDPFHCPAPWGTRIHLGL